MNYPFECKKCDYHEEISMPMSQYTASGHYCPKCGEEMTREVKSLVCGASINKCGGFYRNLN